LPQEKFNNVVRWLKANASSNGADASSNGDRFSALESHAAPNNLVSESKENQMKSFQKETDVARASTTASWGSGALFSSQSPFAFGGYNFFGSVKCLLLRSTLDYNLNTSSSILLCTDSSFICWFLSCLLASWSILVPFFNSQHSNFAAVHVFCFNPHRYHLIIYIC